MNLLFLIVIPTVTPTNGKQILFTTMGRFQSNVMDIVAIDPTNGNVTKLYQLPPLSSLDGFDVCMKIDSKRNLIHILISAVLSSDAVIGSASYIYELSLSDGHLITTFNLSNNFGVGEGFTLWDYDPDTSTLYGLCLNQSSALYWNCLLYTSPSPRDATLSRMPSSA